MKVYIETYGCALNKADTEILLGILRSYGFSETPSIDDADLIIINTCTVRKDTEERMLKRIKNLYEKYGHVKRLVIAGCMATTQPYTIRKVAPSAILVETYNPTAIIELLSNKISKVSPLNKREVYEVVKGPIAIVPIADGCTGYCSFCITKIARPKLHSYPIDLVKRKVKEAIARGAREIQLTAQDTGAYGLDIYGKRKLVELLLELIEIPGDFMVRIGMMNPEHLMEIIDDIVYIIRHPKIYKFLHIPLQSGDDRVLRIMNRRYSVDDYRYIVKYLRKKIEDIMIATDIIVGHPGEDEEAFNNTINVLKELEIERVHLAQYTIRPLTLSAALPQIPPYVKKKRSIKALKVIEEIGLKTHRRYIGVTTKALVLEKGLNNTLVARTRNYYSVILPNDGETSIGEWVNVRITEATYYDLRGTILPN